MNLELSKFSYENGILSVEFILKKEDYKNYLGVIEVEVYSKYEYNISFCYVDKVAKIISEFLDKFEAKIIEEEFLDHNMVEALGFIKVK